MRFNINNCVKVQLTEEGHAVLRAWHDDLYRNHENPPPYTPPVEDADGWSKWQLWHLMQRIGPAIAMGCKPPIRTEIEILET